MAYSRVIFSELHHNFSRNEKKEDDLVVLFDFNKVATSSDIGTGHGVLVIFLVDEDVFLIRIDVTFLGYRDDVT